MFLVPQVWRVPALRAYARLQNEGLERIPLLSPHSVVSTHYTMEGHLQGEGRTCCSPKLKETSNHPSPGISRFSPWVIAPETPTCPKPAQCHGLSYVTGLMCNTEPGHLRGSFAPPEITGSGWASQESGLEVRESAWQSHVPMASCLHKVLKTSWAGTTMAPVSFPSALQLLCQICESNSLLIKLIFLQWLPLKIKAGMVRTPMEDQETQ